MIATVTLNPSLDEWIELSRLRLGALNRAQAFHRYPGGKGINVSRVLHELGVPTIAFALAGGDDGHILSRLLTQHRITHQFLEVPGCTRNNYQIVTRHPKALTQLNAPGPRVSHRVVQRMVRLLTRRQFLPHGVVYSGSLPPGAAASTYEALMRPMRRRGVPTVLDTSGSALRAGLRAHPWLIKPNQEEAEALLGHRLRRLPEEAASAALYLSRQGVEVVAISLGAEGAVVASAARRAVWYARPPRVRVDSTVGAGDSFVAGFVVGWLRTRSLEAATRLGVACGAASAMSPGTQLCRLRDVRRLQPRVRLHALPLPSDD